MANDGDTTKSQVRREHEMNASECLNCYFAILFFRIVYGRVDCLASGEFYFQILFALVL